MWEEANHDQAKEAMWEILSAKQRRYEAVNPWEISGRFGKPFRIKSNDSLFEGRIVGSTTKVSYS